jgi:HEAT repeat protein
MRISSMGLPVALAAMWLSLCGSIAQADEPTYQGRTVTSWLGDLNVEHHSTSGTYSFGIRPDAKEKKAAEALHALGEKALPVLIERLKLTSAAAGLDEDARTAWAFDTLGETARPAIGDLIQLLRPAYDVAESFDIASENWRKPRYVAGALRAIGKESIPPLIDALSDKDEKVRFAAALALDGFPGQGATIVPGLVKVLADPDENVRGRAAQTIGSRADEPQLAVPALIDRLQNEPRDHVRSFVIAALRNFGPRAADAVPALKQIADDSRSPLQREAKEALQALQPPAGNQSK